jgi:hypothetical protein
MAKLGYTWYPKDWNNSEAVFELNLTERGLYRELIDLAMLNDNKTISNISVWRRRWDATEEELKSILLKLSNLGLIEVEDQNIFIPSCESRLNLSRGGKKGGEKKPTPKPVVKPTAKPTPKQKKEKETKVKEYRKFAHLSLSIEEFDSLKEDYTKEQIDEILDSIENYAKNTGYKSLNLTARKWLKKEYPKPSTNKPQILNYDPVN